VGKITSEIGSKLAAFTSFEQARTMQDELIRQHPDEPRFRYELSNSWNEMGRLYLESGEFDRSQEAFQRALDLRQKLVELDPKNPEYERKLANSFMNLGSVFGSRREFDEALKRVAQAIDIQQRLATDHPQEPIYRRDLAKAFYNRALLESRAGRPADALRSCQQALTKFRQLYDEQPRVIDFQGLAALTMRVADELSGQSGKAVDALPVFQQARQLTERLVQRNPLVGDYQAELAAILKRMAEQTADHDQSRQYHVQAKDLLVQLAHDNPQVVRYEADLAGEWLEIGRLELASAKSHDALAAFQRSLETSQAWAAQDGNSDLAQEAEAKALTNIGAVERNTPDLLPDALATYQQVLKIYQGLAAKRAADADIQEGLARTYMNLGLVNDASKKPDDALVAYRSAMEHQRRAVELAPRAPSHRQRLLKQGVELAALHREHGRTLEALEISLEQKQFAADNAEQLFEAARSLSLTAEAIGAADAKLPADKKAERTRAVNAAIDALRDAIAAGLKDVPQQLANPDLRSLHDAPAFRELGPK
jgi:tetratricopeptide (TPR) repeat protein